MKTKGALRLLFIGNSHTYYNDLPFLVRRLAENDGFGCEVAMLAHPDWYLAQHAEEPEVRFNILFGRYDYVVLQEHGHPFAAEEDYRTAARALNALIREAGSIPVIYGGWAKKSEPERQAYMNTVNRRIAAEIGALPAPVGEEWQTYRESRPELELYAEDGGHASPEGSAFAAGIIWKTVRADLEERQHA